MASSPDRARRTPHGEASRQRILEVGAALFAQRGFAATSVSDICAQAGVAKTALYWHFQHKQGLLLAVIEHTHLARIEQIQKSAYEVGDAGLRLERFVAGLRELVEDKGELLHLFQHTALERAEVDPETRAVLRRCAARARAAIVQGIEDALGRSVPDLDLVAQLVLGQLDGIAIAHRLDPEATDLDRHFAHLKQTLALSVLHALQRADESRDATEGDEP